MQTWFQRSLCVPTLLFLSICAVCTPCRAQISVLAPDPSRAHSDAPEKTDGWVDQRDEQAGMTVKTMEMIVHPRAESRPAMKHRLIASEFELLEGNAAVYYLKAMGFLEQTSARERLLKISRDASAKAEEDGKEFVQVPPEVWRMTPPSELPVDEVKEYLRLTAFQTPMLREAARRKWFNMDRNFKEVDDPIAYLLPEIQSMRELARKQSLRCRVAIAENRIDDAIEIIGQQYAMARHLGQDEFLVSNLVGIACASIAWNQALHLVQHPDAPNMYWAFAALPRPLVDMRYSMATEREFLYQQLKVLREVDETPRTTGYWNDFIDRAIGQIGWLAYETGLEIGTDNPESRAAVVAYIAAAYPGAKEYLTEDCGMSPEQVKAYPVAQVVFLAMTRFYDQWRDNYFKWTHVPYWQARAMAGHSELDQAMKKASQEAGFCSAPTMLLLPAVLAARSAEARCDQTIALIQTVEAIRMYGALHNGKLPASLEDLPVPAPVDPITGEPIDYQLLGRRAVLNGHPVPGVRYRLIVKFAQ